ncbi:MAG: hypothetical protein ACI837_001411 [Crocinitomicaceae bacterium]|jgi:hypothetical protein
MKGLFAFALLVLFLLSCKKDRLVKNKSILIGEWEWVHTYTSTTYPGLVTYTITNLHTPITDSSNYQLEFYKRGKVEFFTNDNLFFKRRLVFNKFEPDESQPEYFNFNVYLDNDDDNILVGSVSQDTLILNLAPYNGYSQNISSLLRYQSYYVRK